MAKSLGIGGRGIMRLWLWILPVICAPLTPLSAQARARDDAMAGAFHCAIIADSRQWLDCYYGAAQPVRAQIGLAPALAGQVRLAMAPPGGGAVRDTDIRDQIMAEAARCISVGGDRQWLNCYYDAARPMRVQLGLAVPAQAGPPVRAPVQLAAPQTSVSAGPPPMPRPHGMFSGIFDRPAPVVTNMAMRSYEFGRNGAFVITLEDGEVWKQSDEDQVYHRARWRRPASSMKVTITPGAMNSFNLIVENEAQLYKVRRIR